MKVAYLVNRYPSTSHSFIRREIAALESAGHTVERYSIRRSGDRLVTPADEEESRRTTVLLAAGVAGLLAALLGALLTRPLRLLSALRLSVRISRRSERGLLVNLAYLAEACLLAARLRRSGVEHLHAHFGTNGASVAMLCQELGGPGYSFTIHGPEEFDKPHLIHLREKIERARGVFAVSRFGRSQVYRHCGHQHWPKVHVVRCGVDASFIDAAPSPPPASRRLLSIGRLSEQKGQLLLVEALGELHRRGHDFHLTILGDGEMRAEVERTISRHGVGDKIHLAGWADEASVRQHLLECRALVLPSFAEGLPVVIMEALALGRPVLSTYIAGIPELVETGKNGWLVPAGSVEDLVAALEEVLSTPPERLAELGAEGRRRVLEQHDARKIGAQISGLLETMARQ